MDLRNGIQEFHTLRYQTNNNELNNNSRNGDMNDFRSGNNIHHGTNNNLSINSNLKNAASHIFINDRNNLHLQRSNANMNNVNEIILTSNNVNDLTTQRNNGDYRNSLSDEYSRLNNSGIQDKNLENSLRNNVLNNIERQNSYNHFTISDNISRKLGGSPNVPMDTVKNAIANSMANHIDIHRVNNNLDMHRTNNKIEIRTSNEMRILKPAPMMQAQQISLSSVQTVDSVSYGQPTLYVLPQNSQHDKKFVIIKSEPLDTVQVIDTIFIIRYFINVVTFFSNTILSSM